MATATAKEKKQAELLEQLAAYARNVGSASLEKIALELAELAQVQLNEDRIQDRRKA